MQELYKDFKEFFCQQFYKEKKEELSKKFDEKYIEGFISEMQLKHSIR